jgi:type IV pilus assembly protein PilZ
MPDTQNTESAAKPGVLSLNIKEKSALYAAYMPHVKGGGLFIPTNKSFHLGDEVFMLLSLVDDPAKLPVAGRVVWITPPSSHANKPQGIGVQFGGDEGGINAKNKIENLLAGYSQSGRPTHTM